jgi:hypothetical protein
VGCGSKSSDERMREEAGITTQFDKYNQSSRLLRWLADVPFRGAECVGVVEG